MQLRDIMSLHVETIDPEATVLEAAQKMDRYDIGALPVCADGKVLGFITDRDVTVKVIAKGLDPQQVHSADVMSSPAIYAYEEMDVEQAVLLMETNQIRRLVVLNRDKKVVGIVALADLATRAETGLAGEALESISEPSAINAA